MSRYNTALVTSMVANGAAGSPEANLALYPRVAVGDREAMNEMIESNMSLAISKVDSFIGCFPNLAHLRDDMVSEGFLGLTKAVNKMAEAGPRENPNPTGFMSYWINHGIGTVADREAANGASDRTTRRARQNGEELPHQVAMPPDTDEAMIDPTAEIELRDLIDSCCETETDRVIVAMREKRYTDKEIAAALELPVTTTYMLRRAIYERFLAKSGMRGEV
jgi:DNA-directed RNA polymerase specialized sigma subunit